jgi:uncharacterized protein (DUF983 family)
LELETPSATAPEYACPACGLGGLRLTDSMKLGRRVDVCAVCGHDNLYVQKDFNRNLGMALVVVGVLISLMLFAARRPFLAMLALVAMAVLDAAIYWMVPRVTVCYACHAIYRGFERNPNHQPFNLELLERYGGRSPRN